MAEAKGQQAVKEPTYIERAWDFIMGPTPISPEEKMKEIETRMEKLQSKLDTDVDIKQDDLNRMRKELNKAANKNDEVAVRQIAKNYISLDGQCKKALARRDKVTQQVSKMHDLRVGGLVSKDMLEYVQCHNRLVAPVANPAAVKRTMGQFTMQQEALSLCEEMMNDALEEDSEENEEQEKENKAVEALVSEAMNLSSLNILSKLPTVTTNGLQPPSLNANPTTTANKIQEFLHKK